MKFLEILTTAIIYLIIGYMVLENAGVTLHMPNFETNSLEALLCVSISLNASAKLYQDK